MPETVRIALAEPGRLKWPLRCPRCGGTDDLMWLATTVVRNNRGPENQARAPMMMLYSQESIRFSVLMCGTHAHTNQVAGTLLGRDTKMIVLRASVYASLLCLCVSLYLFARSRFSGFAAFGDVSIAWGLWCLYGALGLGVLAWARDVAWVRPVRLDPDHDVAVMRFKDERYARDFKRMNPQATTGAAVDQAPVWRRMTPMKALLLICGVLVLFALWINR